MALEDFLTDELCVMDKLTVPDGFGGFVYTWQEGAPFMGKAIRKRGDSLLVAQQQGARETFTVTTTEKVHLERDQYIKRMADGATMRIISDPLDGTPPGVSGLKFVYVIAERVSLK